MAEETQSTDTQKTTETIVSDVTVVEDSAAPPPDVAEPATEENAAVEAEETKAEVEEVVDSEKKALDELKQLVVAAIVNNEFALPPPPPVAVTEEKTVVKEEELKTEVAIDAAVTEPPAEEAIKGTPLESSEASATVETTKIETAVESVEKSVVTIEGDGAKTVEAIEETIVSGAGSAEPEVAPDALASEDGKKEAPLVADEKKKETPLDAGDSPEAPAASEDVFIWGVPLVGDERSDTILLKFLRARELKSKDAMEMIKNTVLWRKQFGIDALVEEDLGLPELNKTVYMHGVDKEGHPVCYNVYGEFQNAELYEKAFGDDEKRQRFLKWRIQYLEKGIRERLDFSPGGISSMVQITDLKNSPGRGKHRQVMNQAVTLLQDNYPEFIAKKVFINVPWWNLAYYRMMSSVFTPRTKSKFVFAGPSKSAETLFKYIAPEQVPVAYGGLGKENDPDFSTADAVTEVTIKPTSKQSIEIPAAESSFLTWELRVLGSDVNYGAEFVPSAEEGYTVIVQKARKLVATDEPVVKASFKTGETGKIVLNFENSSSKKKKLLYRFKVNTSTESTF